MKKTEIYQIIICLFLLNTFGVVTALTVGSNTVPSREGRVLFPAADTDNVLLGFASFENGFLFEDSTTTVTFDDLFAVSGDVVLNGGTLYLTKDFKLKNPFNFGVGLFDGEDRYSFELPGDIDDVNVPTVNHTNLLRYVTEMPIYYTADTADWSFDDEYLVIGTEEDPGAYEIRIYSFDGMTLTFTAQIDLGYSAQSARWHPSSYYLATGNVGSGTTELEIYRLNVGSGGALQLIDTANLTSVSAVSWSPDGDYLAVGEVGAPALRVYEVSSGVLGAVYTINISGGANRSVQFNSLNWDSTGSYIVAGLEANGTYAEIKVFSFNGSTLTEEAEFELGSTAYAVEWAPDSTLIAMGTDTSAERLRVYEFDASAGTLTERISARIGDGQTIFGLDWSDDGNFLAIGQIVSSAVYELMIASFDKTNVRLNLVTGYELGETVRAVSYSHSGQYVAVGTAHSVGTDSITVALKFFPEKLIFRDINLFFNSDGIFNGAITFQGDCLVNGGGNILSFNPTCTIIVGTDSSLLISDAILNGVNGTVIQCADSSSAVSFQNVEWIQDGDYSFTVGKFEVLDDFILSGDGYKFIYQTDQVSTVSDNSRMILGNGMTFSYDPSVANRELLSLHSETSNFFLNGATLHSTSTGMRFTNGVFSVDRSSALSNEGTVNAEGISFASGVDIQYFPGAVLDYLQGVIVFE